MTATNVGYLVQFAFIIGAVLFVIGLYAFFKGLFTGNISGE